jgi:hypothetical protein
MRRIALLPVVRRERAHAVFVLDDDDAERLALFRAYQSL